jgi:hypothetical protein
MKECFRLMRVQQRVSKGYEVFEYYANNQWDFNNDDSLEAIKQLNPRERSIYKLDSDENVRTTDSLAAVAHQQTFQNVVRRPHLQDPDPAGLPLPALPPRRGPRSRDVEP